MDIEKAYQIRDIRTKNIIGTKYEDYILVPENGQVVDFIIQYQALKNYDMGMVAELYDEKAKKVNRFVILYAFKEKEHTLLAQMKEYRILEETLSNLDILEIIYQYNTNNEKKES